MKNSNSPRPVLMQVTSNTTFWVGPRPFDIHNHYAGQTFITPANATLHNIQVYAEMVQHPGNVSLTVHSFDDDNKTWGPIIG